MSHDLDNFIEHYGVKGMRWGVTKGKQSTKSLSDSELKSRVARLNLEARYNSLTESSVSKGRRAVVKALQGIGKSILVGLTVSEGSRYAKKLLDKATKG